MQNLHCKCIRYSIKLYLPFCISGYSFTASEAYRKRHLKKEFCPHPRSWSNTKNSEAAAVLKIWGATSNTRSFDGTDFAYKSAKIWGLGKAIIHKSLVEVFLVEQNTIEYVSAAYLKFIIEFPRKNLLFFTFILSNFLVQTLQYLKKSFLPMKTWKKRSQKFLVIGPTFFFSTNRPQTSPKPAQI